MSTVKCVKKKTASTKKKSMESPNVSPVTEIYRQIGSDIRMKTTIWKDEPRIDIRKYEDSTIPTIKGVSLNCKRWNKLMRLGAKIDKAFDDMRHGNIADGCVLVKEHIGGKFYVTMTTPYRICDIRKTFRDSTGELRFTKKGVGLKLDNWTTLKKCESDMINAIPQLDTDRYCMHQNQGEIEYCVECNEF